MINASHTLSVVDRLVRHVAGLEEFGATVLSGAFVARVAILFDETVYLTPPGSHSVENCGRVLLIGMERTLSRRKELNGLIGIGPHAPKYLHQLVHVFAPGLLGRQWHCNPISPAWKAA